MNSTEVKKINFIEFIVRICNHDDIVSLQNNKALFKHPLRSDKNPSLSIFINRENGNWSYKDFALNETGNIIDFVMRNYNISDVSSALKKICVILNITQEQKHIPIEFETKKSTNNNIEIKSIKELNNKALLDYLSERKINILIAQKYLKEVYFSIKKDDEIKNYFGLGFPNREFGYEIRNKYIKSNIGGKELSIIDGKDHNENIMIFEGFTSFLSALTYYNISEPRHDVLILNSVALIDRAIHYIIKGNYKKIYDFLDNDFAGQLCQIQLKQGLSIAYEKKNINYLPNIINGFSIYKNFNDFNDFLINQPPK